VSGARRARWAVATAVGIAAAMWLLRGVEWRTMSDNLARLRYQHIVIAFGGYGLSIVAKSRRFAALLDRACSSRELLGVVAAQTFWSNTLPMRAGDVSYVLLLRGRGSVSGTRAVSSLLVASLLDLWCMMLVALLCTTAFESSAAGSTASRAVAAVAATGVVAMPVGLAVFRWAQPRLSVLGGVPVVGARVASLLQDVSRVAWSASLLRGLGYSTLSLALRFAFQVYLLAVLFPSISAPQGLFALSVAGLVNLLPIQSIGNVGTIELPWAWAMMATGVDAGSAIASGFVLHAIVLVFACIVGALALPLLARAPTEDPRGGN